MNTDPKLKIKEMLSEIMPQGWYVPAEVTIFLLKDDWQDAAKTLRTLEKLTLRFSLTDAKDAARQLADRIAGERHTLERLCREITSPIITDTGEGIGRKMITVAGLEKLLPVLEAEAERQKQEVERAEAVARKRRILGDLVTLIRDLKAGAPISPTCGDEVYELLPWALQEKGAIARAEAGANQSQKRAEAEAVAEIEIERREDDWDYPETPISEAVAYIYDENQKTAKPGDDPYLFQLPVKRANAEE